MKVGRLLSRHLGLSHVPHLLFQTPNASLVIAFIERWHPETNSFHMPFGEMTITLHDVHAILGIPITGHPVRAEGFFEDRALTDFVEFKPTNKNIVLLLSIENMCNNFEHLDDDTIARGYLWHLLGSSLFTDKSGSHVPLEYLSLFKNVHTVGDYAWGAATLAYLYHQLGKASRRESRQMAGCITLLESWIFEYFPLFNRPGGSLWQPGQPRAKRWADSMTRYNDPLQLIIYRNQLDQMTTEDVVWTPYGPVASIPKVSYYHGCIRFLGVNEAYMPDRVARQFGRLQQIPAPPIQLLEGTKLTAAGRTFKKVYGDSDYTWSHMQFHNVPTFNMGPYAYIATQTTDEYMSWYLPRTHVRVHNPDRGDIGVSKHMMFSVSQHRLQPIRETLLRIQQHIQEQPLNDPYMQDQLERLYRFAGIGGLPGVQPGPIDQWRGESNNNNAHPQRFHTAPSGDWHSCPAVTTTMEDKELTADDDD